MFEHKSAPLLARADFFRRVGKSALFSGGLIAGSLGLGVLGYHLFGGLGWIDSILNASMILAGMGPVDVSHTTAGKLFASFYALFSGVAFLTIVGVLFAPLYHRFLHRFHLALAADEDESARTGKRGKRS